MIETVTLLGSSSGRNAGDAALLSGIMDSVDGAFQHRLLYEIPTICPDYIWHNYENRVRPVSMLPWNLSVKMLGLPTFASIMRSDLSLIFDAILFDRSLYNPLFNYMSSLYLMLPLAKRRGKKVACFNVGVGPVTTSAGANMLRELCELMDFITVRDDDSRKILEDLGIKNPHVLVTADAALNIEASKRDRSQALLAKAGLGDASEILAINVSAYLNTWIASTRQPLQKHEFVRVYAAALNRVVEETGAALLFVCTQHHDVPLTREIMEKVSSSCPKGLISNRTCNHYDIKGVLSCVTLLFAMRLHAVILASSSMTPVVALPHQPKVVHFMRSLGLERYALSFDNFSEDALASAITAAWQERKTIHQTLLDVIPRLKRRANLAAQLVLALDRGDDIAKTLQTLRVGGM